MMRKEKVNCVFFRSDTYLTRMSTDKNASELTEEDRGTNTTTPPSCTMTSFVKGHGSYEVKEKS